MDKIGSYRSYIKQLISEYSKYKPSYGEIDVELICVFSWLQKFLSLPIPSMPILSGLMPRRSSISRIYHEMALGSLIHQRLPFFTFGKVMEFLYLHMALASGLYAMTDISDVQQQVLDDPEFEHFRIDFTVSFQDAVEYLLHGILG